MMEEKILTKMLEIYQPKDCDWMGYPISKKNPLSYRIIAHNHLERLADKTNPKNCKIGRKVKDISTGKKEWTVTQRCHMRRSIINRIASKFLSHNLGMNNIALVTKEGLEKLEQLEKLSPALFMEYMYMFQIINDMSCPPAQEIRKIMAIIQNRLEIALARDLVGPKKL